MSDRQHVKVHVSKSGTSLILVLTKQLRSLGVKAGDKVDVLWDERGVEVKKEDQP